jgi:hypothetical protein
MSPRVLLLGARVLGEVSARLYSAAIRLDRVKRLWFCAAMDIRGERREAHAREDRPS